MYKKETRKHYLVVLCLFNIQVDNVQRKFSNNNKIISILPSVLCVNFLNFKPSATGYARTARLF